MSILFIGEWASSSQIERELFEAYRDGSDLQRTEVREKLVSQGDNGLPVLKRILNEAKVLTWDEYRLNLDAIARIGSGRAADFLLARAKRNKFDHAWVLVALARTETKGVDCLVKLSKKWEFHFGGQHDNPIPYPYFDESMLAMEARFAIRYVTDPGAAPALGKLIDSSNMRKSALEALAGMKASGFEEQALRIWQKDKNASALAYLLAVNREKFLPLLQERLKALDDKIARLQRESAEQQEVKDKINYNLGTEANILEAVYALRGDPVAVGTLIRYLDFVGKHNAFAILSLGLSRSPEAKPVLLKLLLDDTIIFAPDYRGGGENSDNYGFTFHKHWRSLLNCAPDYKASAKDAPVFAVAAVALADLGDPSVIPELEQAARLHLTSDNKYFPLRSIFETAIQRLRENDGGTGVKP